MNAHFLEPLLKSDAGRATLVVVRSSGDVTLATTVEAAFDSTTRKRGLLGRDGLSDGQAIVIAPTSAVHTFGMRFAIDIVFAARNGRVVKIARSVPRGRIRFAPGAFAVIEMGAGEAERAGVTIGDFIAIAKAGG